MLDFFPLFPYSLILDFYSWKTRFFKLGWAVGSGKFFAPTLHGLNLKLKFACPLELVVEQSNWNSGSWQQSLFFRARFCFNFLESNLTWLRHFFCLIDCLPFSFSLLFFFLSCLFVAWHSTLNLEFFVSSVRVKNRLSVFCCFFWRG